MEYKNVVTLKEHKAAVYALCEGEKDHLVFSGGSDRHVILWNLKTFEAVKVVAKSPTTIVSLLYIKELNYLLIGQVEGGVHIIDLKLGKEIKYLKVHKGYVFDLKFISDKNELLMVSADGSISIWSMIDYKLLYHKQLCQQKIRKVDVSKDQKYVALALGDHSVAILKIEDWSEDLRINKFLSAVNVVRFSTNYESLLVGEKNAHLYQFDLDTEEVVANIAAHNWAIYDLKFSPNRKFFATASRDKTVKIWDAAKLEVLKRFEGFKDAGHTHSVNVLLWLEYQNYLISAGDDSTLKLWQISD